MDRFSVLSERFPRLPLEKDFSFRRHTTIGCGGVAEVCAMPGSAESAAALLKFLQREKIPYLMMGAGANVLPQEGRFDGVLVRFTGLCGLFLAENGRIFAGAGVTGGALCRFARERSLGGFEPFTGIPMSVGGGIVMNAGVAEGHFSDVVERVYAIDSGKLRGFSLSECEFSEKRSLFQAGLPVIAAVLRGTRTPREILEERSGFFREKRKDLPKGRSMGCCFVNPPGLSAGKLIDECGLKGVSCGGAYVSPRHANFIINEGGSAEDIGKLLSLVKETVQKKTGIALREEIRRLGWDT